MHNYDLVDQVDKRYFQTYQEFMVWLEKTYGNVVSFISEPIEIMDSDNFGKCWKCINVFQSGKVEYKRINSNA